MATSTHSCAVMNTSAFALAEPHLALAAVEPDHAAHGAQVQQLRWRVCRDSQLPHQVDDVALHLALREWRVGRGHKQRSDVNNASTTQHNTGSPSMPLKHTHHV